MRQQRRSEIFEAYSKLAEEKGLVKKEEKESPALKKYKSESYARVGSDTKEAIEALYGLKLETIPGMEYDYNLVEVAHPNAVVVSPAYDAINGLVENINERANIIHNKVMSKAPSGSLFLLKDAKSKLAMELIRIGNDMDNSDEDELRMLADTCLKDLEKQAGWWEDATNYLSKKVVKPLIGGEGESVLSDVSSVGKGAAEGAVTGAVMFAVLTAWFPLTEPIAITAGALTGGVVGGLAAYLVNTGSQVKSVRENSAAFLGQLKDVEDKAPKEAKFFVEMKSVIDQLIKTSDVYLDALDVVRSKEGRGEAASESEISELKKDVAEFVAVIKKFEAEKETFNQKNLEGAFSESLNKIPFLDNDIQDVQKEFLSLSAAIDKLRSTMDRWGGKVVEVAKSQVAAKKPEEVKKPEESSYSQKMFDFLGYKPSKEEQAFFSGN